jgi:hypothetical protein
MGTTCVDPNGGPDNSLSGGSAGMNGMDGRNGGDGHAGSPGQPGQVRFSVVSAPPSS